MASKFKAFLKKFNSPKTATGSPAKKNASSVGQDHKGSDRQLSRVYLIHNPKYRRSGVKSYVYTLRKYHIGPTTDGPYFRSNRVAQQGKFGSGVGGKARFQRNILQKRAAAAAEGEEAAVGGVGADDIQNDSEYLCPVQIGTPAQTLNLDFDTGSADLWVWSTKLNAELQSQGKSDGHNVFDPKQSTTYQEQSGSTWRITYGDQSSASGIVGTDNITIGGLTVNNQAIELADDLSTQFTQNAGDGLLGLAWGNINTVEPRAVATPVENMITQQDIAKGSELFTAYLGSVRDADEADKGKSFYTFGYIDQDTLKAANTTEDAIDYTPVDNSKGFWQFVSASATVNGKSIARSNNTAIADTGTTLALVDDDLCKAIYDAIPGSKFDTTQQGWVFPSNTAADQLPVVTFAVGDKQFAVQKEDLAFADAGNDFVYGGIQSRGDMTFDILGDTFLKGIYAIFDQGNKRFGAVQRIEQHQNLNLHPASGS